MNSYIKAFSDLSDPAVHEQLIKCCQTALCGVDNHQLSDHLTVNDAYNSASNDIYISEQLPTVLEGFDMCDGSDHYGSRRDERTALRFAYVLRVCACLCTASAQSGGTFIFLQDKEHLRTSSKRVTATTTDGRHNVAYVTFSLLLFYSKSFSKNEAKTRSLC